MCDIIFQFIDWIRLLPRRCNNAHIIRMHSWIIDIHYHKGFECEIRRDSVVIYRFSESIADNIIRLYIAAVTLSIVTVNGLQIYNYAESGLNEETVSRESFILCVPDEFNIMCGLIMTSPCLQIRIN